MNGCSRRGRIAPWIVGAALLFAAPLAHAQGAADLATARQLGLEAQQALDAKDYKTAEDKFRRADAIYGGGKDVHAATLLLGLARAQVGLGHYVAAQENYNRIIRDGVQPGSPPAFAKAVEDAKAEVDSVAPHIGGVIINVTGAESPKVVVDGSVVIPVAALGIKRPIDPGNHTVKATADGYKPAEKPFSVTEGGAPATVDLALEKDPNAVVATAPPAGGAAPAQGGGAPPGGEHAAVSSGGSTTKTLAYVALGVGAAGVVVGGITGVLALSKHGSLSDNCKDGTCDPTKVKQSDIDSYHTMGTISTVGFVVGGVGLAAGAVLLVVAPKSAPATALALPAHDRAFVRPYVGPDGVGAFGRF